MARPLSENTRRTIIERIPNYAELLQEEAEAAIIRVIADDFFLFCERNLYIEDKITSEVIPLIDVVNWQQRQLLKAVMKDILDGKPVRYIILKARQMGLSTIIEALGYWWTITHRNIHTLIIAHDSDAAESLYEMFKRYFDYSHSHFQPTRKYNNKKQLVFDVEDRLKEEWTEHISMCRESETCGVSHKPPGLGSSIKTMVAKDGKGRSMKNHFFHGCLHEKSLVVLADGSSKMIKDVNLGDLVTTSSGAVAPVTAKTMTGVKQTYKLNTWMSNQPIIASADHKILTEGGYKKLSDIKSTDWIAKPRYQFNHQAEWSYELPLCHRPQNGGTSRQSSVSFDLNEDFGYLVGYYLAEGHIGKKLGRVTFTYEATETFCERINKFFPNAPKYIVEGNRKRSVFNSVFMANALNELCGRVANKHVPLFGNNDFFKGIYRGYMDGDGSKTDEQRERAPSVHERIARNINRIGDMQGVHGSLHYAERERYGVPSKPIWINSFCNGPSSKYKFINGQCFVRVKSITPYEVATTYDLEIDHPDHNFETPSGVVSNSEVAFWEAKADVVSAAIQTVPLAPKTFVFLESTANGVGGFFYDTWQSAKRGESNLRPLFFAWHEHEEYQIRGTCNDLYDEEETLLMEIFFEKNYDREVWDWKILWRREKKKEFIDDPKKFYQEYPKDDMEAFIASGRPRFDTKMLMKMEAYAIKHGSYKKGAFKYGQIVPNSDESARERYLFDEVAQLLEGSDPTPLKVWEMPLKREPGVEGRKNDMKYIIAGDVSEGKLNKESRKKENDYSVLDVMRADNLTTVARWRGHIDPDLLGGVANALGRFYNTALMGIEVNNHGLTTIQSLRNKNYPNLYMRENNEEHRFQERTSLMGWRTDKKTKKIIIDNLAQAIREGDIIDLDVIFIRECMTYIRDDQGYTNAQEGQFDDTVMAKAIALKLSDYESIDTQELKTKISKPVKRNTNATTGSNSKLDSIARPGSKRSSYAEAISRRRAKRASHKAGRRVR